MVLERDCSREPCSQKLIFLYQKSKREMRRRKTVSVNRMKSVRLLVPWHVDRHLYLFAPNQHALFISLLLYQPTHGAVKSR